MHSGSRIAMLTWFAGAGVFTEFGLPRMLR